VLCTWLEWVGEGAQKFVRKCCGTNVLETVRLEDRAGDATVTLRWTLKRCCEGGSWMDLAALDRVQWRS
jgi:hypothetical protein